MGDSLGHLQPLCPLGGVFSASWGGPGANFASGCKKFPVIVPFRLCFFFRFVITTNMLWALPDHASSSSLATTPADRATFSAASSSSAAGDGLLELGAPSGAAADVLPASCRLRALHGPRRTAASWRTHGAQQPRLQLRQHHTHPGVVLLPQHGHEARGELVVSPRLNHRRDGPGRARAPLPRLAP